MDTKTDGQIEAVGEHNSFENSYLGLRNSINTLSGARLGKGNDKISEAVNGLNNLIGISEEAPVLSFVNINQDLVSQSLLWEKRTWEDLTKFRDAVEKTQFLSSEAREQALKHVESLEENLGIPDHVKSTDYILKRINNR